MQVLNWLLRVTGAAGSSDKSDKTNRATAKDRMRQMLIYDRLELPPDRLACLEEELAAVVCRYFDIDRDTTRFDLQQYERKASLIANFPLLRSKT